MFLFVFFEITVQRLLFYTVQNVEIKDGKESFTIFLIALFFGVAAGILHYYG